MMEQPPLPNEGILWHRNKENGYYRKKQAAIIKDTVLVLKPMSVTTRLFSTGTLELDVADSLVQVVPAPRLDKPNDEGSPQQRVFNKNRSRQCYFRVVHKGKAVELKARDNVERDKWVSCLLSLMDRTQKPDETFPFGIPPRDTDENTITPMPSPDSPRSASVFGGAKGKNVAGQQQPGGAKGKSGVNDTTSSPTAASPTSNVEGIETIESTDDDDELETVVDGESFVKSPIAQEEPEPTDPNIWRITEPSSDVNIAPKILIDPPSDRSTPIDAMSPKTTKRRRNKENFEEASNDLHNETQSTIVNVRAETRGFISRLSEMVTFGTIQLPPRKHHFIDSVFASSVLEEGSHLGNTNGMPHFHTADKDRGAATLQSGVAAAVKDGLHLQLIPMQHGNGAGMPSMSTLTAKGVQRSASFRVNRHTPTSPTSSKNSRSTTPCPDEYDVDEVTALDARIAFDQKGAVVSTSSRDTIIHIPYSALEALKPRGIRHQQGSSSCASKPDTEPLLSRLEVYYWWHAAEGVNAMHHEDDSTFFPSNNQLQRVVLGFTSSLDLKVCLKVLLERHQTATNNSEKEVEADAESKKKGDTPKSAGQEGARMAEYCNTDSQQPQHHSPNKEGEDDEAHSSSASLSSPISTRSKTPDHHHHHDEHVDPWWQQRHQVGTRRSLLLHQPHGQRFFAAKNNSRMTGGIGDTFSSSGSTASKPRAADGPHRSMFKLDGEEHDALRRHNTFSRAEHDELLKQAYLDHVCHKNVQHFLAASKGFY